MHRLITAFIIGFIGNSAFAADDRIISLARLRAMSDANYIALVSRAQSAGYAYSPNAIASGLRRHYQEMRARLVDHGYIILDCGDT